MGLAILSLVFSKDKSELGILALPVITYHSVQMIFASIALPALRSYVHRQKTVDLEEIEESLLENHCDA